MGLIRSKNTRPEMAVRSILHRLGYRFRLHKKSLPGSPDIVLARHRAVIFVHGCFWHSHDACRRGIIPKSRPEFWADKFEKNIARDRGNVEALQGQGWRVLVVWECQVATKSIHDLEQVLISFLGR